MSSERLSFDVFGRRIDVERTEEGWTAFLPGGDGKRRLANIPIPSELDADGITQYLDDLFHEGSSASYPRVRRLGIERPGTPSCELVSPTSAEMWAAYHDIRRRVLFESRGRFGVYDPNYPDDGSTRNFPKILVDGSTVVGVVRVDLGDEIAYLRRVAIDEPHQRKGLGRVLVRLAEDFARTEGAKRVESAVALDAVTFYEKCGYRLLGTAGSESVQMYKDLATP